ncbi:MAG TPA: LysM peptidoglycan-binding domain-containing protein [bacterium]|nr:LysM peptidoglycan-binding domain-containing protein [bacterium]
MRTWYVQPGDTLYEIAMAERVPISFLLTANPTLDPDNIVPGQEIIIPSGSDFNLDSECPSGVFWIVAPGDTLYHIAHTVEINLADLLMANPSVDPLNLRIGQKICLPSGAIVPPEIPPCPSGLFWVVESGDTLHKIAEASGVSIADILALNPGVDPNNLEPRTNICLPGG